MSANQASITAAKEMATVQAQHSFSGMLSDMFPTSVVQAMAEGNLLQIVVFSLFFALAICAVGRRQNLLWMF